MIYSHSGRKRPAVDRPADSFGKGTIMSTDYADFSDFEKILFNRNNLFSLKSVSSAKSADQSVLL